MAILGRREKWTIQSWREPLRKFMLSPAIVGRDATSTLSQHSMHVVPSP
jgi:hypothetical protein